MSMLLGGLLMGAGQGIVEAAKAKREETQAELDRQFQMRRDELAFERQRALNEDDQAFRSSLMERERQYQLEDEEREQAREDEFAARGADALSGLLEGDTVSMGDDPDNVAYVARVLDGNGLGIEDPTIRSYAVSGILGNLMQESGPGLNTEASGDGGSSIGMGQWHDPRPGEGRAEMLKEFAASQNPPRDWRDIEVQAQFLVWELHNTDYGQRTLRQLQRARSPEEAAVIASRSFWMPGDPQEENRSSYARQTHDALELLLHPDTPPQARDAIAQGLGLDDDATDDEPLTYGSQFFAEGSDVDGDGEPDVTRHGTNSKTGQIEEILNDGSPIVQPSRASDTEDFELDDTVEDAVAEEFFDPADQAMAADEIERLVKEGIADSQSQALTMVRDGAVYEMTGVVDNSNNPFSFGEGGGEVTWRSDEPAPENLQESRQGRLVGFKYQDAAEAGDSAADGEVQGESVEAPENAAAPATSSTTGPSPEQIGAMSYDQLLHVNMDGWTMEQITAWNEAMTAKGPN